MARVHCEDCDFKRERDVSIDLAQETAEYHTRQTGHVSVISHNWPCPPAAVIPCQVCDGRGCWACGS